MDIHTMLKLICDHPIVAHEIGFDIKLGFPWLYRQAGTLFVQFLPHREVLYDGRLYIAMPVYRLDVVYPFRHISRFQNYALEGGRKVAEFAFSVDAKEFLEESKRQSTHLYTVGNSVLDAQARGDTDAGIALNEYGKAFAACVEALRLTRIYSAQGEYECFE